MSFRSCLLTLVLAILFTAIACAPAPTPAPTAPPVARPAATFAPAATAAAAAPPAAASPGAGAAPQVSLGAAQRKIIKNAQLLLTVENTDTALDRLTGVTVDMGGYILSTRTFFEGGLKAATITFAVPVDRFEETLRRVRGVALKVEQESASGQDVSDQYVDLESQLKNLEATADRIRDFLKKAQTVDEALKVNQQLSQVEKDIETIKGKMNYIQDRSAFSTITAELREPRPTPTPTLTPTPTPTPTPVGWHPDQTLKRAIDTQSTLFRTFADLGIWVVVLLLPYLIVFGVFVWLIARVLRWMGKRPRRAPGSPPKTTDTP